jgi:endoglucanase
MYRKSLPLLALGSLAVFVLSCGHEQQLTSITVQPTTETFGAANIPVAANAGSSVQLRALGNYIHPPVTKDITNNVTWNSNTPQMMTVSTTGLLTATGNACGNTLVSATVTTNSSPGGISSSGSIVTGYMTGNVVCFTATGGGGGTSATLSVNFSGTGSGTVTSSPSGLSCAGNCTTTFPTGTNVTLTAAPSASSTFGGWIGCDGVVGQVCSVNNLTGARSVAVTFN